MVSQGAVQGSQPLPIQLGCPSGLKPRSRWTPFSKIKDHIEIFFDTVSQELVALQRKFESHTNHDNLTMAEQAAISALRSRRDIIIKPSDKGGNVVVMNTRDYMAEAQRQLYDGVTYEVVSMDCIERFKTELNTLLAGFMASGLLTKEELAFLTVPFPKVPTFYLLPKIHKHPTRPPGRPIVAGIGWLTEPLAQFLDFHLRTYVLHLRSYIRDTTHFIQRLADCDWAEGFLLCTLDVTSLYSIIRVGDGLEAVRYFLDQLSISHLQHSCMLMSLLEFCLTHNVFLFNDSLYHQKVGTAMGTPIAPTFANLFMGWWEETKLGCGQLRRWQRYIKHYVRYIDDLFVIWSGTQEQWLEFVEDLNVNDLNLQFSAMCSTESVVFLDLEVYILEGKVHHKLYIKPTAGNTLLCASSAHPRACISAIPYGEMIRTKRNCSHDDDLEVALTRVHSRFQNRGYGNRLLNLTRRKVDSIPRTTLYTPKAKVEAAEEPVRMTLQYSCHAKQVQAIFTKNWPILMADRNLKDLIPMHPDFSISRSRNLGDLLSPSHFSLQPPVYHPNITQGGFSSCGRCKACHKTSYSVQSVRCSLKRSPYAIRDTIGCETVNCIYMIQCVCGLQYIGSSTLPVRERIKQHFRAIRNQDRSYSVAVHCQEKHNSDDSVVTFWGLRVVHPHPRGGNSERILRKEESKLIILFNTVSPHGLNVSTGLSLFL